MSMWKQLVTLVRGTAHEAGQSVADARALTILDQQMRDAGTAQAKARDDLATLTARRRMDLARQVAERLSTIEQDGSAKLPQVEEMRAAEDRMRAIIQSGDGKIEALRREVDVVRANESVQKAQAAVAGNYGGTLSQLGSAAESLQRMKERQAIQGEKFRAAAELEDSRTGADLDAKLKAAGLLPGASSADDILARLSAPPQGEALRLPDGSRAPSRD
jgi:phage shock protein A